MDPLIRSAKVTIRTGRKWNAQAEVDHAVSTLRHREVMGAVQTSRAGLGWGEPQEFWSKASKRQQKGDIPGQPRGVDTMGSRCRQAHHLGRHLEDATSQA